MGQPETLTIHSENGTVRFAGEIDAASAASCQAAIEAARPTDGKLLVDLSGVTFIDSSGLRVIVKAHQSVELIGAKLVLLNASPAVARLFEITGLTNYLNGTDA